MCSNSYSRYIGFNILKISDLSKLIFYKPIQCPSGAMHSYICYHRLMCLSDGLYILSYAYEHGTTWGLSGRRLLLPYTSCCVSHSCHLAHFCFIITMWVIQHLGLSDKFARALICSGEFPLNFGVSEIFGRAPKLSEEMMRIPV